MIKNQVIIDKHNVFHVGKDLVEERKKEFFLKLEDFSEIICSLE